MSDRNPPIPNRDPRIISSNSSTWLSVEQIRKMQRMRRERVIEAMLSGDLPYEQRGRIRYARLCDVTAWEESRLVRSPDAQPRIIHRDLLDLL